jgi:hypothetical protein
VRILFPAAVIAVAIVAAACAADRGERSRIDVALREWSIEIDRDTVPRGQVTFDVRNEGPDHVHELVVIRSDFAPDSLPARADGSADTGASGVRVIGEIRDVAANGSSAGVYTLEPGSYVLICNIVDEHEGERIVHYELGMYRALTVTEGE